MAPLLGALALACACGPSSGPGADRAATRGDATTTGAEALPTSPPRAPAPTIADACQGRGEVGAEEIAAIPADVRLAVVLDLRAADLDPALDRLEVWARDEGARVPVVAQLALQQIGFQARWIRDLLRARGLELDGLALLIGPGGAPIWLWRIACDVDPLRRALEARWDLRIRALAAGGLVAEPRDPAAFPFDLVLTTGDRMALVPAGKGTALLRWFGRVGAPAGLGPGDAAESPADALARTDAAAARVVIAGRSEHGVAVTLSGEAPNARRLRVTGAAIEIDGSVPP